MQAALYMEPIRPCIRTCCKVQSTTYSSYTYHSMTVKRFELYIHFPFLLQLFISVFSSRPIQYKVKHQTTFEFASCKMQISNLNSPHCKYPQVCICQLTHTLDNHLFIIYLFTHLSYLYQFPRGQTPAINPDDIRI